MKNITFSKEPIIWVGAIIAALMIIQDIHQNQFGQDSLDALAVAIGAVIGRHYVSPVDEE